MPNKYTPARPVFIPISASIAYVELSNGMHSLIDSWNAERVGEFNWSASRIGNHWRVSRGGTIYLSRFIMPCDEFVDHRNENSLDNREANLRPATRSQNAMNKRPPANNTSGVKGVYRSFTKWEAEIMVNQKKIRLGRFALKEEAIEARKEAERTYFGEYSALARVP